MSLAADLFWGQKDWTNFADSSQNERTFKAFLGKDHDGTEHQKDSGRGEGRPAFH
jgi:hypothetical protein